MIQPIGSSSLIQRLMGVITLKAPIYKEIAEDPAATMPATAITLVVAAITSLGALLTGHVFDFVVGIIGAAATWVFSSFVAGFVAERMGGKTSTAEMLRVIGHTNVFNLFGLLGCVGAIAALVLRTIAFVIAIREAAEFDTQKAVLTALIVFLVGVAISIIVGLLTGGLSALTGAMPAQ